MTKEARVLIIEDDDVLRVMLFTILRHQPLAVDTASSVQAALEKASTCDYALILIDMSLAAGTAEEFLRWFREERSSDVPSFIIAVRDPNHDVGIDSSVVKAVLTKPLEINTLAEVVRECAPIVQLPAREDESCPPAESDVRSALERGSYMLN